MSSKETFLLYAGTFASMGFFLKKSFLKWGMMFILSICDFVSD
jgi:hypothetical protein